MLGVIAAAWLQATSAKAPKSKFLVGQPNFDELHKLIERLLAET